MRAKRCLAFALALALGIHSTRDGSGSVTSSYEKTSQLLYVYSTPE